MSLWQVFQFKRENFPHCPLWVEGQPYGDVDKSYTGGIAVDSDGSFMFVGSWDDYPRTSDDGGISWDVITMPVAASGYSHACSQTGIRLFSSLWAGDLYTSDDYGVTWTTHDLYPGDPPGVGSPWACVASDIDGSFLIAGMWSPNIYTIRSRLWLSSDYGANWTESRPYGDHERVYSDVACDDDGSNLIVCSSSPTWSYSRLFTSSDSGAHWIERIPAGGRLDHDDDQAWSSVDSSSDGSILVACHSHRSSSGYWPGRIWISTNFGVNWRESKPVVLNESLFEEVLWGSIACSSNGQHIIVNGSVHTIAGYHNGIYCSDDYGISWYEETPAGIGEYNWNFVDISADGLTKMVSSYPGRLYICHI